MQRHRQTTEELLGCLSPIKACWKDSHAESVTNVITAIPEKTAYSRSDIELILEKNFKAGLTVIRLVLDKSKDELQISLKHALGGSGTAIKRFNNDRRAYLAALEKLGVIAAIQDLVNTPVSWRNILVERLKLGRGSAIKGQARGRFLEDFIEAIVSRVFANYDRRCRFVGADGTSTEKADFAIPGQGDPAIRIEVKAYGATGSKQTDILGDIKRIAGEKRHDTELLLVTDGETWKARINDLRKLVDLQNQGLIARIYTQSMAEELERGFRRLALDHAL